MPSHDPKQLLRGFLTVAAILAGLLLVFDNGVTRGSSMVLLGSLAVFLLCGSVLFNFYFGGMRHQNIQGIRKVMGWAFGSTCLMYVLTPRSSILYAIHRRYAFLPLRNALTAVLFGVAVPIICGMAWWAIWKGRPSARGWGIAASLMHIPIFLWPIIFLSLSGWWHHIGALLIGAVGLVAFSSPNQQYDYVETPSEAGAEGGTWLKLS